MAMGLGRGLSVRWEAVVQPTKTGELMRGMGVAVGDGAGSGEI